MEVSLRIWNLNDPQMESHLAAEGVGRWSGRRGLQGAAKVGREMAERIKNALTGVGSGPYFSHTSEWTRVTSAPPFFHTCNTDDRSKSCSRFSDSLQADLFVCCSKRSLST